jgi:Ser/Thr protein kinase RdoA (MazF antagonist)
MKTFYDLSRRGRLVRAKDLAQKALAAYGLEGARLGFVQYTANMIYRVDEPGMAAAPVAGSPYIPGCYVLRIHGMGDEKAIYSELTWLRALNAEADLPVPAPVPTLDGSLVTVISTTGIPHRWVVSLLRWLDGRKLEKGLRPKHLMALGQVMARLHDFSAIWQPPAGFTRPCWDWDGQLGGRSFGQPVEELVDSMPIPFQAPFLQVSQEARQAMQALGNGADAFGLIHADMYPENVLFRGGEAYPIDFEDLGYGYWIWDIAVALCTWAWGVDWERMRDAFREGYARVRALPEAQWALLDLFVATQFATMLLWASAFLKDDPQRSTEYLPWRDDSGKKMLSYFERSID